MRARVVFALILAAALAFVTVAYAGSDPNGYYDHLPIVRVVVNGSLLTPDVPAVILNGRTMVPISYVASALAGVSVWSQSTMTASISTGPTNANLYTELSVIEQDIVAKIDDANAINLKWLNGATPTAADESQASADAQAIQNDLTMLSEYAVTAAPVQIQARSQVFSLGATGYQEAEWVGAAAIDFLAGQQTKYQDGVVAANDADLWAETIYPDVQQAMSNLNAAK